jgi:hypothetical protein
MNSTFKHQPFTVTFAVLLGLLLAPLIGIVHDSLQDAWDKAFPVVRINAKIVSASSEEVIISMYGAKERDCTFLRVQAFVRMNDRELADVNIRRVDVVENGDTKKLGNYFMGTWRVWPIDGAKGVVIDVNHLCGNHIVVTRVADLLI